MEEAGYFKAVEKYVKDKVEEAYLAEVEEVDLAVAMEEE